MAQRRLPSLAYCTQTAWTDAGPIAAWSNARLQAPQPHMIELLVAASQHQSIADTFAGFFEQPVEAWELMSSAERTAAFLRRHGWQGMPQMLQAA